MKPRRFYPLVVVWVWGALALPTVAWVICSDIQKDGGDLAMAFMEYVLAGTMLMGAALGVGMAVAGWRGKL